jgi:hypothetical protein
MSLARCSILFSAIAWCPSAHSGITEHFQNAHNLELSAVYRYAMSGMESAMNAIGWDLRNVTVQTHSGLRWSDIKWQFADWRQLEGLDIGFL